MLGLVTSPASALSDPFIDDFEDGDPTDNSPVSWTPIDVLPGVYGLQDVDIPPDGELEYTLAPPAGGAPSDLTGIMAVDLDVEDVSITAQVRKIQDSVFADEYVGVMARITPVDPGAPTNDFTFYWAYLTQGGILAIGHYDGPSPQTPRWNVLQRRHVDLDVTQDDVLLQFDVEGNRMSLWAWRPDEPKPTEPLVRLFDGKYASGGVGLMSSDGPEGDEDSVGVFRWVEVAPLINPLALQAGDSNMDLQFDQSDLVHVLMAEKYQNGQPATWGEGDWDGAPGGQPGEPPPGDGVFNRTDIVAALTNGLYLQGPYAAINQGGTQKDAQASIIYNAITGEVAVDAPAGQALTSINIDSAAGIFTGQPAQNLGGSFDNDVDNNIFKATFGSSFGSVTFGLAAEPGLSEEFMAGDLTVVGSLEGGGDLGDVDLVYIPEPSSQVLLALASVGLMIRLRSHRRRR